MKPKTLKSCFGVLCLLAAGTANAAKISFSEKGWVDIGALVQAQYRIEQDAAGSGHDPSNDFLLRRARIVMSGQFNDNIGWIISTDVTYGAAVIGGPTRRAPRNNRSVPRGAAAPPKGPKGVLRAAGLTL